MCCNGVLFADLQLQPGDNLVGLRALDLRIRLKPARAAAQSRSKIPHLLQPCAAYCNCCCRIYANRPTHCRDFECLLLKRVKRKRLSQPQALRTIRRTIRLVGHIRKLLNALGDADEHLPLRTRFRRTARRIEGTGGDPAQAAQYGELTLAVHDLNSLIREHFYPGD